MRGWIRLIGVLVAVFLFEARGEDAPLVDRIIVPPTKQKSNAEGPAAAAFSAKVEVELFWSADTLKRIAAHDGNCLVYLPDNHSRLTAERIVAQVLRTYLILMASGARRIDRDMANKSQEPVIEDAVLWLRKSLEGYRFSRVERDDPGDCFALEFVHASDARRKIWAVWRATGEGTTRLYNDPMKIVRAERMPVGDETKQPVEVVQEIEGFMALKAEWFPVLIWLKDR